ncbi:putative ferric-chelate reductase 1 [Brachionichthys hirsutus]|uniref:putative ferric-chelate reductase 1 n=1 Tax=Brachionichthys hirsutus TaxID=412623 RepID=UPI003604A794
MERGFLLLLAALMLYVSPAVHGTSHLSFDNSSQPNITRDGCGTTKLCVENPAGCIPCAGNSCLFSSLVIGMAMPPNGYQATVQLSGESGGYVAIGLIMSQDITKLFACGQNNGTFAFVTAELNTTSNMITGVETRVTGIRYRLNGTMIECDFNITSVNATGSNSGTTFNVTLGVGTLNGTTLGPFNASLTTGPLNLADPAANTVVNSTTASPNVTTTVNSTTASSAGSTGPGHAPAVLILLGAFFVFPMLGA